MKRRKKLEKIAITIGLTVTFIYFLGPIGWLVISSIQPEGELTAIPPQWIPHNISLENFQAFFNPALRSKLNVPGVASDVGSSLINSTIIALLVALSNLVLAVPAAYSFARFKSRAMSFWYILLLVFRMVPAVAIVVPFYIVIRASGLLGSYFSVILAHSAFTLPLVVWILRGFFIGTPVDLEEAAQLDGCSRLGALLRITLPVMTPGLVAAAVFAFMFSWNEFFF
ncbi:MAG: carbohydrate ABC transporter permease, partial [Spirochaetota bacterium]